MNSDAPTFTVRAPRFNIRTPIVFRYAEEKATGHSVDISESGMLGVFDQHLNVWLTGRLTAVIGERHIDIGVRVVRVEEHMAAFTFQRLSKGNLIAIQQVIEQSTGVSSRS
jgi:hypothetical protein